MNPTTKAEAPSPFISLKELGEIVIAYRKAHPEIQIVVENQALEEQNKALRDALLKVYQTDDLPKHIEGLIEPFVDESDRYTRFDEEPPGPGQEP